MIYTDATLEAAAATVRSFSFSRKYCKAPEWHNLVVFAQLAKHPNCPLH
jgi:hypothetical protein